MKDKQWLIDRAAARAADARAASGMPPLKDGEGPPLFIPGLVWESPARKFGGWRPPEPTPAPIDPREQARRDHTHALVAEAVAGIDPALIAAARAALDVSAATAALVNALETEKRDLVEPLTERAVLASLTIDRRLEAARRAAKQTGDQTMHALAELRAALTFSLDHNCTMRERLRARELDDQAELLAQQAGDIRVAPVLARGALENYLPPSEQSEPPVVEPAKSTRRKRLFERNPNQ